MTESRTYVTEDLWFPCEDCGKKITHHTIHTCSPQLRQLQAECIDKDSRILDMQYKIKDLEYQVKMLNDLLQPKKAWRDFDVDGRC